VPAPGPHVGWDQIADLGRHGVRLVPAARFLANLAW
jgi:hypothetical protein